MSTKIQGASVFRSLAVRNDDNSEIVIFADPNDPSNTGFDAPLGSLLIRVNGSIIDLFQKIGLLNTDWILIGGVSGNGGTYIRSTPTMDNGNTDDGLTFTSVAQALDAILYPATAAKFTSISIVGGMLRYEVGFQLIDPDFNYTLSMLTGLDLTYGVWIENETPSTIGLIQPLALTNGTVETSGVFSRNSPGSLAFTAKAVRLDLSPIQKVLTTYWDFRIYYGKNASTNILLGDQNDLKILDNAVNSVLQPLFVGNYIFDASLSAEYLYLAFPVNLVDTPIFYISGFETVFSFLGTTSGFVNDHGIAIEYNVYRSPNPTMGTITVAVGS